MDVFGSCDCAAPPPTKGEGRGPLYKCSERRVSHRTGLGYHCQRSGPTECHGGGEGACLRHRPTHPRGAMGGRLPRPVPRGGGVAMGRRGGRTAVARAAVQLC